MDYSFYVDRYESTLFLLPREFPISDELIELKISGRRVEWFKFGQTIRGHRPDAVIIDQRELERYLNPRSQAEFHKNRDWYMSEVKPMNHRADMIFTKRKD